MNCDEILASPPIKWEEIANVLASDELRDKSDWLDALAIESARCARYFSARSLGKSHREAVKAANSAVRSLAKSLGYAYPKSHDLSF